ncbi:MAG: tetratricopeptide repeat-containing sensor histidine kinase [Bacteroidota bacterium]
MKLLLIFSLASVLFFSPLSGRSYIDSLYSVWEHSPRQERYELSIQLGKLIAPDSIDKAQRMFKEAANIAARLEDPRSEARACIIAADVFERYGEDLEDRRNSITLYSRANMLCQEAQDPDCQARTWFLAGRGYLRFEQYELAIYDLIRAADIYQYLQDTSALIICYIHMGEVYQLTGALDQAQDYAERAKEMADQIGQDSLYGKINYNLGVYHLATENYPAARRHLEESLELSIIFRRNQETINSMNRIGETLFKMEEYKRAEQSFIQALQLAKTLDDQKGMADSYNWLGALYLARNKYSKAKTFLNRSTSISEQELLNEQLLKNYQLYSDLYMAIGNVQEFARYSEMHDRLRESIHSTQQKEILIKQDILYQRQEMLHELELNKLKEKTLNIELTARGAQMQVAILIVILLLVLAAFSYRQSITKQQANRQLEQLVSQRTEDLQLANAELDTFAYRTAHDIRGPVARLLGLCQLVMDESDLALSQRYIQLLKQEAVSMDVMLHRFLEVNHLKHIKEEDQLVNVQTLLADVLETSREIEGFAEMEIDIQVEPALFVKTKPRLLTIMLKNVIENAISFRKKDGKSPNTISILGFQDADRIIFRILDNGIGIDERVAPDIFNMFYRGTHTSTGLGLGLYATKQAADRLGANVCLVPENRKKTEFRIDLPKEIHSIDEVVETS